MSESIKRASWLELFYDLAFVALVAQLTYLAADHHNDVTDLLNIFLIGYMIFTAWWGTTANRNLQESEDVTDKIMVQLQMAGAFIMSIAMPGVFEGEVGPFLASFAIVRGLQILMILRLYRLYPDQKPVTQNILQGIVVATVLWVAAGFVEAPYGYIVAFAALALDILTPLSTGKGNQIRLLNIGHLQERLGLFLMLVIGESMLVVALANTAVSAELERPFFVFSGLIMMIGLWWVYYWHLERLGEGVRPKNLFLYLHAHGFLFGSIILLAAGYKNMIKHGEAYTADFLLVTAGAIGVTITLTVIRNALHGRLRRLTFMSVPSVILIGLIAWWALMHGYTTEAIGIYTVLMAVLALVDVKVLNSIANRLALESEE